MNAGNSKKTGRDMFTLLNKAVFGKSADAYHALADVFGKGGHKGLSTMMISHELAERISGKE